MELRLKQIRLHIDWLMLLLPVVAVALGEGRSMALMLLSLSVHECGHLLTAAILHIRISHLRLTPFGAMARIENPYSISASRLFGVASAGPVASLLAALTAAALCNWRLLSASACVEIVQINLLLMLFNLIPALPLDGGRMLYAVLTRFVPRRRAVETGILAGRILAALLMILSIRICFVERQVNLSLVFAALFLLTSAQDERRALTDSRIQTLMDCMRPPDEPLPVSMVAISTQTSAETALQSARPDHVTLFAVYDQGRFSKLVDDRTLLSRILDNTKEKNIQ